MKLFKAAGIAAGVYLGHSSLMSLYGRWCITHVFGIVPIADTGIVCQGMFWTSSFLWSHVYRAIQIMYKIV